MTTNFANANYQEVIDLHTEADTVSVIGIHSPNTETPQKMLAGFWRQFRKFKYNGCSISLVPAARLPADPLQVSYKAGEPTIDPRDMLNPIMFHGCHGNDLGSVLNQFYGSTTSTSDVEVTKSDSIEQNTLSSSAVGNDFLEALYYKALTDNTWKKAHPQAGFRKSGLTPMVHRVVANFPYGFHQVGNIVKSDIDVSGTNVSVGGVGSLLDSVEDGQVFAQLGTTKATTQWMTSKLEPLGWMDTYSVHGYSDSVALSGNAANDAKALGSMFASQTTTNRIPKVFMGVIMLPPAYKTEQYFRLIINHNLSFSGFRGASMDCTSEEMVNNAPSVFDLN